MNRREFEALDEKIGYWFYRIVPVFFYFPVFFKGCAHGMPSFVQSAIEYALIFSFFYYIYKIYEFAVRYIKRPKKS